MLYTRSYLRAMTLISNTCEFHYISLACLTSALWSSKKGCSSAANLARLMVSSWYAHAHFDNSSNPNTGFQKLQVLQKRLLIKPFAAATSSDWTMRRTLETWTMSCWQQWRHCKTPKADPVSWRHATNHQRHQLLSLLRLRQVLGWLTVAHCSVGSWMK